jgi:hypothetical protein
VTRLRVARRGPDVVLRLVGKAPTDLELWDVAHEALLFSRVFGAKLRVEAKRG